MAAVIIWFQHRLQLKAEESRERRQLALEIEAIELPLCEVLIILKATQASTVDNLTYRSHGSDTCMQKDAGRIEVAMGLLRGFIAGKPQWVMPFCWPTRRPSRRFK